MLEALNARLLLAKSRLRVPIDQEEANEVAVVAYEEAHSLGVQYPDMTLGPLFDEPLLAIAFHDGASCISRLLSEKQHQA